MSTPALEFDTARRALCMDATYEIEALAAALPGLVPKELDIDGVHFVVRGIAARLVHLSGVVMAGLGDDAADTSDLQYSVSGSIE
nr:hypothetical protein [uncultured Albidiferax sp.]